MELGGIIGGDLKAKSANIRASKVLPHALTLIKYGIHMCRGSHITQNKRIEAIGFDGGSLNN